MRGDSSENSSVLEVRGIPYGQCFVIFLKDLCLAMIMGKNPQKNYPLWPIYLEHKLWATFSLSHIFIQPTFSLHVTVHHVHVHEKRGSEWKKWVWVKKWAEWKSGPSEKVGSLKERAHHKGWPPPLTVSASWFFLHFWNLHAMSTVSPFSPVSTVFPVTSVPHLPGQPYIQCALYILCLLCLLAHPPASQGCFSHHHASNN